MSDNWLRVIPTLPGYVPTGPQAAAAVVLLRSLAPAAENVSVAKADEIVFVDAGSNFKSVRCPACSAELPIVWWQDQMDRCFETRFGDLAAMTPCCARSTSLNDLVYDWPQGFARWSIEAFNPNRGRLDAAELEALAATIGHEIREVWTHI